ncbi:MAG TPA: hypothetical protein VHE36_05520 [Sphingomicrobium sp.]|jgi:hypothetical protein|nr:hypothetical protein [Sphingomicrobium sp.]
MKRVPDHKDRRPLGRISIDTKGASGPDLEMIGLWHKPGLSR